MNHYIGFAAREDTDETVNVSQHIVADSYGDAWAAWHKTCQWYRLGRPVAVVEHPTGLPR